MVGDLVSSIERAELRAGDQIPSLVSLAKRYGLSKPTVLATLQPLLDDGTLCAVPSVGMFVGEVRDRRPGCYVMLTGPDRPGLEGPPLHNTSHGFEDRITWHGGACAVLTVDDYLTQHAAGSLPPVRGIFSFVAGSSTDILSTLDDFARLVVYLGGRRPPEGAEDDRVTYVDLDNVSGGRLAAEALLRSGHERIAFLGLHAPGVPHFGWSRQRAEGWETAMRRRQPRGDLVSIHPDPPRGSGAGHYERALSQVASHAADQLPRFDACVGADDLVLTHLADELRARGIDRSLWPAMVGFEGLQSAEGYVLTSVRPRWTDLGRMAADHLVQGSTMRRSLTRVSEVAMTVISRPLLLSNSQA